MFGKHSYTLSTFIEDDPANKKKPVEFTEVIKPEHVEPNTASTSVTASPSTDISLPPESQGGMIAASISESKEWKPFLSQLNDAQIKDVKKYAPQEQFQIEVDGKLKTYTRRKIKTKDYAQLEQIRAKLGAAATGIERTTLQIEVFQKAALYYLGMSAEDFDNCDFETIKKVIDANNIRTLYGVPNSP